MDEHAREALKTGGVIDITTRGRQTGLPRRIEIVYHVIDGRVYISGQPRADRKRRWLLNLEANPGFAFHLKGSLKADLAARARVVTDEAERREVLTYVARAWRRDDIDEMVAHSPLIEVTFEE